MHTLPSRSQLDRNVSRGSKTGRSISKLEEKANHRLHFDQPSTDSHLILAVAHVPQAFPVAALVIVESASSFASQSATFSHHGP